MAARRRRDRGAFVPLRIEARRGRVGTALSVVGVPSTGARPEQAELVIPVPPAHRLGWWPTVPEGTETWKYEGAAGTPFLVHAVRKGLRIRVVVPDRQTRSMVCDGVIAPGSREILVSAELMGRLGIVVVDARTGLWCFRDELGRVTRRSARRQLW